MMWSMFGIERGESNFAMPGIDAQWQNGSVDFKLFECTFPCVTAGFRMLLVCKRSVQNSIHPVSVVLCESDLWLMVKKFFVWRIASSVCTAFTSVSSLNFKLYDENYITRHFIGALECLNHPQRKHTHTHKDGRWCWWFAIIREYTKLILIQSNTVGC